MLGDLVLVNFVVDLAVVGEPMDAGVVVLIKAVDGSVVAMVGTEGAAVTTGVAVSEVLISVVVGTGNNAIAGTISIDIE